MSLYLTYFLFEQLPYFNSKKTLHTHKHMRHTHTANCKGDKSIKGEKKHYLDLSICFDAKCASQQKAFVI